MWGSGVSRPMATESDGHGGETVGRAAVFEASPDAIVVVDGETGTIVDANPAAVDFFGTEREGLCDQTLGSLCQNEEGTAAVLEAVLAGERARREWEMEQADGTRWVDVTVTGADDDRHVLVFLRDVTERRELELGLRRERGVTERVLDTTPTGIIVHDASGEITMANPRAEAVLGLETSKLSGRRYDDDAFDIRTVDGEPLAEDDVPFARIKAAGEPVTGEQVIVSSPDGDRIISVSGTPLWDDGEFDGAVMSIQDVTSEFETKAQIREQKEHLETVIEHLPVVLFALDTDGTFTLSRGRGLESLGLEPGELNGTTVFDAYGDNHEIRAAAERALSGESVRTTQQVGGRWFDTTYRPVTDDGGEVQQVIGVSLDVTAREKRQQRLAANDAILTQLTETTDDVFWLFDGDFAEVQFVNDAYEDIWGRSIADVKDDPMDFMNGIHPDDREMVADAVDRLRNGESTDHEYRVNPDEGYDRWVWVRGEPIVGEDGDVERVAGFARDITERKRREQELERSKRQFDAVFNDPQLLVALLDIDGTVDQINETALEYADADGAEMTGKPFWETPWWSHDQAMQADLQEWLDRASAGEYVEYEATHPLPHGGEITVEGTIRPVVGEDGTPQSLIASARNVTERIEHERQLEESNARLEKFAYVASHDLQEPLRTISNYIELVAEEYADDLDEEAEEFIDVVVTGSERMQSMINGLLDYSRVTTRGDEFEPVDTEQAVTDVVSDLQVMLREHDGSVEVGSLPTVEADGDQFRQLVQNLVKNALEHGEDDVDIEIRAEEGPESFRFEVRDDGPGIEPNRQEKIFRIFKSSKQYQTSSQAKGIGLAICDNIAQRHGGDIWVESTPGEGATFVFTVPKQQ